MQVSEANLIGSGTSEHWVNEDGPQAKKAKVSRPRQTRHRARPATAPPSSGRAQISARGSQRVPQGSGRLRAAQAGTSHVAAASGCAFSVRTLGVTDVPPPPAACGRQRSKACKRQHPSWRDLSRVSSGLVSFWKGQWEEAGSHGGWRLLTCSPGH